MRSFAVIGSGQAGLLAAHGLLRAGFEVTLYSDRTPEDWLERARPTGTAVRFARSLAYERELGLDHGHARAPRMHGLKLSISAGAAKPILSMLARFESSPLAIDLRLQSCEWMRELVRRGGQLKIESVSAQRVHEIAEAHALTIVATGKEGGALFERDAARSPATAPARRLAMVNVRGPALELRGVPFPAARFQVFEGIGECYWTPYHHMDGEPIWNLVFEAQPGRASDRFGNAKSAADVVAIAKQLVRELAPWDSAWLEHAEPADPNSWLIGAITPTVRHPLRITQSGRPIVPLGDAYMSFDPLGAQGANMGNRLARVLVDSIVARDGAPFDAEWIARTYAGFYERWGGPAMRWTQLLLGPMRLGARYLLLAQQGADGVNTTPKQQLADAFVRGFDDPGELTDTLVNLARTRRWVSDLLGRRADWEAASGLLRVASRQLRSRSTGVAEQSALS
ncbi:MAG TPA: styrene monooxygenase/indole monooxygenase family protein [Polyangiales bacterium]|nr:styrene monooxygenase/indole monooxygenase family protein [Polyangiales bacterium]